MKGIVNDACLFLIYKAFRLGKLLEYRSRKTAGVCIPEHTTPA